MQSFSITTLGCKVNQYESDQIATLLRARGLRQVAGGGGDLRIINTCSVTVQAAGKSRQLTRRATRSEKPGESPGTRGRLSLPVLSTSANEGCTTLPNAETSTESYFQAADPSNSSRPRVIVTGCWATSDTAEAAALSGMDAVLVHYDPGAEEIEHLLADWGTEDAERFTVA